MTPAERDRSYGIHVDPGIVAIVRMVRAAGNEGISPTMLRQHLPQQIELMTGTKALREWDQDRIREVLDEVNDDGQSGRMFEKAKWGKYRLCMEPTC